MMASAPQTIVIGIFETPGKAKQAYEELRRKGIPQEDIGYLARQEQPKDVQQSSPPAPRLEDIGAGGGIGAILGAVFGGVGVAGVVTGLGPIIAGGMFAYAGAVMGSLSGLIASLLRSEEDAHYYEHELEAGHILLAIRTNDPPDQVAAILDKLGGRVRVERERKETRV